MKYAKIVLGLPVEGPFDYLLNGDLIQKAAIGKRVKVSFGAQKKVGYITGLSSSSTVKNIKPVLQIIDEVPVLDKEMLSLARELSEYYCCSFGEAIETMLPESLRRGKALKLSAGGRIKPKAGGLKADISLIHDLGKYSRWEIYLRNIRETLENNKSVIFLLADKELVFKARDIIKEKLKLEPSVLYRNQPHEAEEWVKIKSGAVKVIVATRSGVFAPLDDLGLIIIDEEQDQIYKQEQTPHYHAREVAFMRSRLAGLKLILASSSPSLEMFYLSQRKRLKYDVLPRQENYPKIEIVNTANLLSYANKKNIIFTRYLEDSIASELNSSSKVLVFINRLGFATYSYCHTCLAALKCPRCNCSLVYHFNRNLLICHHCTFKMPLPRICPSCNSGYIKLSGLGTEKLESELSRIFPQARIRRLEGTEVKEWGNFDIFISTQTVLKNTDYNFGLIAVFMLDNFLNRPDFRAAEKTYALLSGLAGLTEKKLIIQTNLASHYCFKALKDRDPDSFYREELKQRRQLSLPPLRHFALLKFRAKNEKRVEEAASRSFQALVDLNKDKGIKVISVNPGEPMKLRDNFYWQILLSSRSALKLSRFLKLNLKKMPHSGIIVTVDIDPL